VVVGRLGAVNRLCTVLGSWRCSHLHEWICAWGPSTHAHCQGQFQQQFFVVTATPSPQEWQWSHDHRWGRGVQWLSFLLTVNALQVSQHICKLFTDVLAFLEVLLYVLYTENINELIMGSLCLFVCPPSSQSSKPQNGFWWNLVSGCTVKCVSGI
jgi:hypothetical protein